MFCHGGAQKICCESMETAGPSTKEPNSLNIRPNTTEAPKATTYASQISTTTKQIVNLSTLITTNSPIKNSKIGLSEATYKNDKLSEKNSERSDNAKAYAVKTAKIDEDGELKYQPHASGGYAVSQKFDKLTESDIINKKEVVQQYLLEQIKKGWPYDDQFFRPSSKTYFAFNN